MIMRTYPNHLKNDNEYYKKKYISLNRKKKLLIITEILAGSGSAI